MTFSLVDLNYGLDFLSPYLSSETLDFHHNKHHKTYVDNLNKLIVWTQFEHLSLEEIIKTTERGSPMFNNAAQVWNHDFYFGQFIRWFEAIKPWKLLDMINQKWWGFDEFIQEFNKMALSNFGSWWTWLTYDEKDNWLNIWDTSNANTPLTSKKEEWLLIPLLVCDVWEHAYYVDYRNRRWEYLDNFWKIINWEIIEKRFTII